MAQLANKIQPLKMELAKFAHDQKNENIGNGLIYIVFVKSTHENAKKIRTSKWTQSKSA